MKSRITTVITGFLSASLLLNSCTSSSQAAAGLTGAAIGSNIGGAIGSVTGGSGYYYGPWYRYYNGQGAALGSLIGMGVGAALGVAIQKSVEDSERRSYESQYDNSYENSQGYSQQPERENQGGAYYNNQYGGAYNNYSDRQSIRISGLTYRDGNGDGYMSKGETLEVETYIKNVSKSTLYNVYISLDTQDSRYAIVSSPLTITLDPGQKVRYSGRIYCRRSKKNRIVPLTVSVSAGNQTVQSETLQLEMR